METKEETIKCPACGNEFKTICGRTFEDFYWMLNYFNEHKIEINPKK